jgi:hypothetical protein
MSARNLTLGWRWFQVTGYERITLISRRTSAVGVVISDFTHGADSARAGTRVFAFTVDASQVA